MYKTECYCYFLGLLTRPTYAQFDKQVSLNNWFKLLFMLALIQGWHCEINARDSYGPFKVYLNISLSPNISTLETTQKCTVTIQHTFTVKSTVTIALTEKIRFIYALLSYATVIFKYGTRSVHSFVKQPILILSRALGCASSRILLPTSCMIFVYRDNIQAYSMLRTSFSLLYSCTVLASIPRQLLTGQLFQAESRTLNKK